MSEREDVCLTSRAAGEGIDDIGVTDIEELVLLLGEVLDVLAEGLIGPLPAIVLVPRVTGPSVCTLKVLDECRAEIPQQRMLPGPTTCARPSLSLTGVGADTAPQSHRRTPWPGPHGKH
jgi:hypothetical protein